MTRLTPADPHDVGVEEQIPDLAQLEGAHLLANEARPYLADCGFSEHQILEWAETYIALEGSGDLASFLAWIGDCEEAARKMTP